MSAASIMAKPAVGRADDMNAPFMVSTPSASGLRTWTGGPAIPIMAPRTAICVLNVRGVSHAVGRPLVTGYVAISNCDEPGHRPISFARFVVRDHQRNRAPTLWLCCRHRGCRNIGPWPVCGERSDHLCSPIASIGRGSEECPRAAPVPAIADADTVCPI